jgi:anti-sigma B factor antagonist
MDDLYSLASEAFSDAACITLTGEWDIANSAAIVGEAANLVEADHTALVIDLRQVTYMDSTALSALLQIQKSAEEFGWHLAVVRPRDPLVWRLFEMTALDQRFLFFATRAAALVDAAVAGRQLWAT